MWTSTSEPYLSRRPAGQADAWTDGADHSEGHHSQRILEVTETAPPAAVSAALQLPESDSAIVRRRLILLDDRPIEIAESWYPASVARGTPLAEPRKIKGGAVTALAEMGYESHHVREDVSARTATPAEAESLALADGAPVLVLFRTVLTAVDVPFEVTVMTMTAEGRHLQYELTAG